MLAVRLLHEYTHYGDDQDGVDCIGAVGNGEEGEVFELTAYGQVVSGINAIQIIDQWRQQQENQKKQEGFYSLLSNFNNLKEGKYEWNGTS